MQGVTTAIVGFIFVCIVFPSLVKVRAQWYAALGAVLLIILLDAIKAMVIGSAAASVALYVFIALLQIASIGLLILSCGGLTARELAEDMKRAYKVIRRGEEETEIIIPRPDRVEYAPPQEGRTVYVVDDPQPAGDKPSTGPATSDPSRSDEST